MTYEALAKHLVARARKKGARQAEAYIEVSRESSCRVRDGQVEDLTQATSKGVGVRVISKNRLGFAYSSDFDPASLDSFVDRALDLAQAAAPNALNGLPTRADLAHRAKAADLFDPKVANLAGDWKLKTALEMEKAAKSFDPRVSTFESVGAGEAVSEVYVASSEGLVDGYSGTSIYLYAAPVATDGTQLQTSYWIDYKRHLDELDAPEAVGREAARRAVRMLGAKKVKSQKAPVIFDPLMAASFVAQVAKAADGDAIFKKSSILAGRLGKKLAGDRLSIVDDGLLPRGIATSPFDGEGIATRRTPILEGGVLKSYLYDSFTARKAKAHSTGNANRGYSSLPSIGFNNLYLEAGAVAPEEMIRGVKNGFYVTAMLGHGADIVTGDYSRGANGLWIQDGELAAPVQEVTIAGNLLTMLESVDAIGTDLQFRGTVGAPTLRFAELTISGE